MATLTVAAAQLSCGPDPAENLKAALEAIAAGAARGARLVVTPEATMAAFGSDLAAAAEPLDGPWAGAVLAAAREHGVTVVVGMFEPADAGRVFNTLLVAGPGGEVSRYRKRHLFDAFGVRESDTVAAGDELVTVAVDGVRVGLATCYDVRFADQFSALGRAGAQLVVLPASWGDGPGKAEQWDLVTRARAADAQAWLLACDQAWTPPRGSAPLGIGRSVLADPWGSVRARLGAEPGLLLAEVDTDVVDEARSRLPLLG
jgi:deaminated glutathione amidase